MLLPDFLSTTTSSIELLHNKEFIHHLFVTFSRVIPGNFISIIFGVPLGISLSLYPCIRLLFEPMLSFIRGVPVAALFPVVIILFGIGEVARTFLVFYVALPIVITSAMYGAVERPENSGRRHYLKIHSKNIASWHMPLCLLWDALPSIFGGLKIAVSLSLAIIIVSEMFFVGGSGVGWYAWNEYQAFNLSKMYASIFIIGIMSVTLNKTLDIMKTTVEKLSR